MCSTNHVYCYLRLGLLKSMGQIYCASVEHHGSQLPYTCQKHVIRLNIAVIGCDSTVGVIQQASLDDLMVPLALKKNL